MGRYYSGDIEGKFWFGLQSSDAAGRFGGNQYEPQYIEFHFEEDHLGEIEEEIQAIETSLGDKLAILEDFFKNGQGYNDKDLVNLGVSEEELSEYADLLLGRQIRDHVKQFGECRFEAEF